MKKEYTFNIVGTVSVSAANLEEAEDKASDCCNQFDGFELEVQEWN